MILQPLVSAVQLASRHMHSAEHQTEVNDMPMPPMPMPMMMPMHFWSGNEVTYLFKDIRSDSSSTFFLGVALTFLLGFVIEFVSFLRKYVHMLAQLAGIKAAVRISQNAPVIDVRVNCGLRLLLTLIYMTMVTLAYFLMLLIMSFNVGLFFAAVGGLATGNFLFGLISLP